MSDLLVRLEVLRRVIDEGSKTLPWCGNTAIQKLMYVLEHVYKIDLGYPYGLHHYGPYSYELSNTMSLGEQAGFWSSTAVLFNSRQGIASGKKFEVKSPELPQHVAQASAAQWDIVAPNLSTALARLSGFSSKDLELVATLHYLQHVQQVDPGLLRDIFRKLKPGFTDADYARGLQKVAELEHSAQAA